MLDAADGTSVSTIAIVLRGHARRIEVQVARVGAAGRVRRRRPIVAVRADVVQTAAVVAGADTGSRRKAQSLE